MNALVDGDIIEALYRASQAGVKIDLIVRGICCLRPRRPGREREHHACAASWTGSSSTAAFFILKTPASRRSLPGSADWMPRNFFRRIEVVFPIEDGNLRERVISELLALPLRDNVKARIMRRTGRTSATSPGAAKPPPQPDGIHRDAHCGSPRPARARAKSKYPRSNSRPRPAASIAAGSGFIIYFPVKFSAIATALRMALDLLTVSWNSPSGVESFTQPPPACT